MNILKFGGTSMADEDTWKQVLGIIKNTVEPVVVVSATAKTTDSLLLAAEEARKGDLDEATSISSHIEKRHKNLLKQFLATNNAESKSVKKECFDWIEDHVTKLNNYLLGIHTLGELTPKSTDAISSLGERLSSYLLAACGKALGMDTFYVDSRKILKTDSVYGRAKPYMNEITESAEFLQYRIERGEIPIIGGFYGSNEDGEITTLGRGGSDYSASLIGLALGAEAIQIWTDVSGMYTSDPRHIQGAEPIRHISFGEAAELAYFGARVLHPATIQPAVEKDIPVYVKNTFEPDDAGTRITAEEASDTAIRAIAFKKDIIVITVTSSRMLMAYGFLSRVFDIFEQYHVSVDVVTTSEVSVSMTVDSEQYLQEIVNELEEISHVEIKQGQGLVTVVGQNFLNATGIAGSAFSALSDIPIRMISQGSSNNNITLVVDNEHVIKTAQALHDTFFNSK